MDVSEPNVVQLAKDVMGPEGPVCLSDGAWAVAEMGRGTVTRIESDGLTRRVLAETGRPNGLARDGNDGLWVAESKLPALLYIDSAGVVSTRASSHDGLPFLWPNDLCFGPDDLLYFTDSGARLADVINLDRPSEVYDLPFDGRVFRLCPETGVVEMLDSGLLFANGIAWGPEGNIFYVSETMTGNIYRYSVREDGGVGSRQLFSNVMRRHPESYARIAGPDGMAFDEEGTLYVGVVRQGDIAVIRPDGDLRGYLEIPGDFPTNLAFVGSTTAKMLVTEGSLHQLLLLDMPAPGLALHTGVV